MTYALRLSDDETTRYRLMAERAREDEAGLWELAGLVAGAHVVDVGCGPGAFLSVIAETIGPEGWVTGVDTSMDAVRAARELLSIQDITNAEVIRASADATGLLPASYDVAMMRHVLAHNGGREQAIVDHLAALVRPSGSVYLFDIDASAGRPVPDQPDLLDLADRYARWHTMRGNDLLVGRRLADLGKAAGLATVAFQPLIVTAAPPTGMRGPAWAARHALMAAGLAGDADVDRWDTAFAEVAAWPEPPVLTLGAHVAVCRRPAE